MQFVKGGPDIPEALLQAHEEGRVAFFCGAGISSPAGLPGFEDLVKKLYRDLGIICNPVRQAAFEAKRYDTAVSLLESDYVGGRLGVRRKIAEILASDTSAPPATATHEALLTLATCRDQRCRLVTTNFDQLFERAITNRQFSTKRYQAPLLPVPKQRWNGLVYLHGLLPKEPNDEALDNLVVSSGDFGLAYLTEGWAARFVSELLRNFVVCFVGYSLDDPILRYMMDSLAADRLLGEARHEAFAFGCYTKHKEKICTDEWRAKNVTPILYQAHQRHAYLHRTLHAWAEIYCNGIHGKEHIVLEYAAARPNGSTRQDNFVGRMMWALSDPSGRPAKRFANMNPVPNLDWLESFDEDRFKYSELIGFVVPPTANIDTVMKQLICWIMRHLGNSSLLLWVVKRGGKLHPELAELIRDRLDKLTDLERDGKHKELNRIREAAPHAIPDKRMYVLWGLVLSDQIKCSGTDNSFYTWRSRLERDGLTTTLRLNLRDMLSPRVSLSDPFRWPLGDEESADIRQLVDWEISLSTNDVHEYLKELRGNESWTAALPMLLADFTGLLRDALDLMGQLGSADDKSDSSYLDQPSISHHQQNRHSRDWTALIELNRDAWLATAAVSPDQAWLVAEVWSQIPYPLFRRLTLFAATRYRIVPPSQSLDWLLADDSWWLWSVETQRETIRLLATLGPLFQGPELARLECAILSGAPRDMYKSSISEQERMRIQDRDTWLRLAKMDRVGTTLSTVARERLDELSSMYSDWQLDSNERDEFPVWMGAIHQPHVHKTTPRTRSELIEWLRLNPKRDDWCHDDWQRRCRDKPSDVASALFTLAKEGIWPADRWSDALYQWSDKELQEWSWNTIGPVLNRAPKEKLQAFCHEASSWLKNLATIFDKNEPIFLALCDRVLEINYELKEEEDNDPVHSAINHPVGFVTEALILFWHREHLEDGQGLEDKLKFRFSRLCNTQVPKFRYGRVILASRLISLFRVDCKWTTEFMLPLFRWEDSKLEARSVWEGFLWSPRLYLPLMESLKPAFLNTAKHCSELSETDRDQYASFLTFVGLDHRDIFQDRELALAMQTLPQEALDDAARMFFRLVDSAGSQRTDYWRNKAAPYLESIWPKENQKISDTVSESFARACIAAGDAFPAALEDVLSWLRPLQSPYVVVDSLQQRRLDEHQPVSALRLLGRVVSDSIQGDFGNLKLCLSTILDARQEIKTDACFERLQEIVRRNEN